MNKSTPLKFIFWFFILLPVAIFFWLFFRYTVNAPINDDYAAILNFINNFVTTRPLTEKIKLLWEQANEHRIVYDRIWTIISFKLFNTINFNFLSLIGNLSLIGITLVFLKRFGNLNRPLYFFIPITVLIFNFASWENITFPMCALSNFTVYLFILLSLLFLASSEAASKKNLFLAGIFFILAVFTQGGGLSLIPISLFILIYKKEYKNLLIYSILILVVLAIYFYNYTSPSHPGSLSDTLLDLKGRVVLFIFAFLGNALNYFLVFTNNTAESIGITSIAGFCLFILFLYVTKTKYYRKNLFNYSIMLLVIFTACLTAISRASFGLEMAAASRYRINGIIFLVALYFWFIETYPIQKRKSQIILFSLTAIYFLMINLNNYEYLDIREQQTNLRIFAFNSGDHSLLSEDSTEAVHFAKILDRSAALHTYRYPTNEALLSYFPYSERQNSRSNIPDDPAVNMTKSVRVIYKFGDNYFIDGFAFLDGKSADKQKVYIGFKSPGDQYPVFFRTKQFARYDLNPFFHKFNLRNGGYRARIQVSDIKAGENKVWLMVESGGQQKIAETDKSIIK